MLTKSDWRTPNVSSSLILALARLTRLLSQLGSSATITPISLVTYIKRLIITVRIIIQNMSFLLLIFFRLVVVTYQNIYFIYKPLEYKSSLHISEQVKHQTDQGFIPQGIALNPAIDQMKFIHFIIL